jgi:hypothetical protein
VYFNQPVFNCRWPSEHESALEINRVVWFDFELKLHYQNRKLTTQDLYHYKSAIGKQTLSVLCWNPWSSDRLHFNFIIAIKVIYWQHWQYFQLNLGGLKAEVCHLMFGAPTKQSPSTPPAPNRRHRSITRNNRRTFQKCYWSNGYNVSTSRKFASITFA